MDGRVRIGTLTMTRGSMAFTYTPDALDLGLGVPVLSVSLPTVNRPMRGASVHAFFNGLLPEGDARRMIAHDFGIDPGDAFALLAALGRDCAGALVILPEGQDLPVQGTPTLVSESDIAERIRNLRFSPLGVDQQLRVSLAGMQEKLLLARGSEGWALPVDGAPSTHILKPRHRLLGDTVANEAMCMRVAHHLGIPVAPIEILTFDGVEVLAVERFDRRRDGELVERIHQEDLCQAHGLEPERKYEAAGGPSLRRCAATISDWSPTRRSIEELLDLTTVNVLVGNTDAHAKNLGLLHGRDGSIALAPAYDIMSTTFYPAVSTLAAMKVNGTRDIDQVTAQDIVAEARSWGLPASLASERIHELIEAAPAAITAAADETDAPDDLVAHLSARARRFAP